MTLVLQQNRFVVESPDPAILRRLLADPASPHILNINCWNEWTEGSYLEPDVITGMKYLEAVREVFGSVPESK